MFTVLICADRAVFSAHYHQAAANRTAQGNRAVPLGKITGRIIRASVEDLAAMGLLDNQISAAFRAGNSDLFDLLLQPLSIAAFRISAAGNELPEPSNPVNQRPSAVRAISANRFRRCFGIVPPLTVAEMTPRTIFEQTIRGKSVFTVSMPIAPII